MAHACAAAAAAAATAADADDIKTEPPLYILGRTDGNLKVAPIAAPLAVLRVGTALVATGTACGGWRVGSLGVVVWWCGGSWWGWNWAMVVVVVGEEWWKGRGLLYLHEGARRQAGGGSEYHNAAGVGEAVAAQISRQMA